MTQSPSINVNHCNCYFRPIYFSGTEVGEKMGEGKIKVFMGGGGGKNPAIMYISMPRKIMKYLSKYSS